MTGREKLLSEINKDLTHPDGGDLIAPCPHDIGMKVPSDCRATDITCAECWKFALEQEYDK